MRGGRCRERSTIGALAYRIEWRKTTATQDVDRTITNIIIVQSNQKDYAKNMKVLHKTIARSISRRI